MDMGCCYLGLQLKNPLVASSSPLTGDIESIRQLEKAGIAAIVLPSLFEENLASDLSLGKAALDFDFSEAVFNATNMQAQPCVSHLEQYLEKIRTIKKTSEIPLIASLNGHSMSSWITHARQLEEAGCDALELNFYHIAADVYETAAEIEAQYVLLLDALRNHIRIPITVKLTSQHTSLANYIQQLKDSGAAGVVLFNRFYQPLINLDTLKLEPTLLLSSPNETQERIRWIALLSRKINLSFAATGGFHKTEDILRAVLAGADAVYMCSALLQQGSGLISNVLDEMARWLEKKNYSSLQEVKGRLSQDSLAQEEAGLYARSSYVSVLQNYQISPIKSV